MTENRKTKLFLHLKKWLEKAAIDYNYNTLKRYLEENGYRHIMEKTANGLPPLKRRRIENLRVRSVF